MLSRTFHTFAQCALTLCMFSAPIMADCTIEGLLSNFEDYSKKNQMDAVLLLRNGKPLFQYNSNAQTTHFDTMEIRDSLMAIAIMQLLDSGQISSLEDPINYYIPDCITNLTLRHLLSSYFGQTRADSSIALSKVIQKASGKQLETYFLENLFLPLGITDICWRTTWESPTPHLHLSSSDLAKIGTLILNKGFWNGRQVISERRLEMLLLPSQTNNPFLGMQWQLELYETACWWDDELLETYRQFGIDDFIVTKLAALEGRVLYCSGQFFGTYYLVFSPNDLATAFGSQENADAFILAAQSKGLPLARFKQGGVKSISAIGQGGQQLLIFPRENLIAVRQKRLPSPPCRDSLNREFTLLLDTIAQPSVLPIE
ncbi:MAG: serine hydrolase [Parachlamydiaceae bacterium]|nr:serine hydrolase [Parachlamydiaceae bacterium]